MHALYHIYFEFHHIEISLNCLNGMISIHDDL